MMLSQFTDELRSFTDEIINEITTDSSMLGFSGIVVMLNWKASTKIGRSPDWSPRKRRN
jgi:hypothetical protein